MIDPAEVMNESRPMLEHFLTDVGIYRSGQPIADRVLLERFSDWLDAQEVEDNDFWYVVARVGAFICEYLIEGYSAQRMTDGKHILLRLPIDPSSGLHREFDPYAVAVSLLRKRQPLKDFLNTLCG
jgi:hypothetical protein